MPNLSTIFAADDGPSQVETGSAPMQDDTAGETATGDGAGDGEARSDGGDTVLTTPDDWVDG